MLIQGCYKKVDCEKLVKSRNVDGKCCDSDYCNWRSKMRETSPIQSQLQKGVDHPINQVSGDNQAVLFTNQGELW